MAFQALAAEPGGAPTTSQAGSKSCAAATTEASATAAAATRHEWVAGALEFRPTLPRLHLLACLGGAAAAAAAAAACRVLPGGGWSAALLLFALLAAAARGWLHERQFQALQRSERDLAGPTSRFHSVDGVEYHYTQHGGSGGSAGGRAPGSEPPPPPLLVHCVHGLGASSFSWEGFVQEELAGALGSHAVVTAHDMPGFGLTQRSARTHHYSTAANAAAVRAIQDVVEAQLAARHRRHGSNALPAHRVLIGHSLGGAVAAEACIADPENVAALVLVAPCVLAWRPPPDAAPLPPSRSLGRALSLWSRALEPPSAPALLGAGARRTLHSTKSMLAPPHLHSLARLLSMAEGMPEGGSGSGSGLVTPTSAAAKAGSQAAEAIAANPSDTAGERNGHAVHFDDATLQSLAHTSPALRLRGSAAVAEEAVSEVQASGPSLAPASGPARHQAKQSRRQALARAAAALAQAALVAAARAALIAAEPLLVLVLRSIVRSRRFWADGLASAVGAGAAVSRRHVDGYRMAQLVQGWERGVLRFVEARLAEKPGLGAAWRQARRLAGTPSQAERLTRVLARRRHISVLIVHGDADLVVPPANSARLAAQLPRARLVSWRGVGHMPHEEDPQRFVDEVAAWLAEVLPDEWAS